MPTFKNYATLFYVNLAFIIQIMLISYFAYAEQVRQNWPEHRCSPPHWIFSTDANKDFNHCVQSNQLNTIGYSLQPLTYLLSSMSDQNKKTSGDINNTRKSSSQTRTLTSGIMSDLYGTSMGLATDLQKMNYGLHDTISKLSGAMTTMMYIMEGANETMVSVWGGPTGGMVRTLSCFHPHTIVCLENGDRIWMNRIRINDVLSDGSRVFAVMQIAATEQLYKISRGGVDGTSIYVTGSHHIYDSVKNIFVPVFMHNSAKQQSKKTSEYYSCLITSTGRIILGDNIFMDWEDDTVCTINEKLNS